MAKKSSLQTAQVFIFSALACEAKAIITHYQLKKQVQFHEFAIYRHAHYCLAVTGVGKSAMAAAVAYTLASIEHTANPVLLNIGIAGHPHHARGESFIAAKVCDVDSGKNFYPQLVYSAPCAALTLCTVAKPLTVYAEQHLYDMEGSAFFETAVRFSSAELIQCFKVVSDNSKHGIKGINAKQVQLWIQSCLSQVQELVTAMTALATLIPVQQAQAYDDIIQMWRFSVSEQIYLKKLLLRWLVITDGEQPDLSNRSFKQGKQVIGWIEQAIEQLEYSLS